MNKKISELIDKATTIEEHGWGASYEHFDKQKFAELIIQEAEYAFWSEACHVSDLAYEEYSRNSNKIKEHFGVK